MSEHASECSAEEVMRAFREGAEDPVRAFQEGYAEGAQQVRDQALAELQEVAKEVGGLLLTATDIALKAALSLGGLD